MLATGADMIDIDWMSIYDDAFRVCGNEPRFAVNFDPVSFYCMARHNKYMMQWLHVSENPSKYVYCRGCEVPGKTPIENCKW